MLEVGALVALAAPRGKAFNSHYSKLVMESARATTQALATAALQALVEESISITSWVKLPRGVCPLLPNARAKLH